MLRFAVLKGVEGFGDRLQCLLQAIRYAQKTERILVVDWRDTDWTHKHNELDFEDFFRLKGVNQFGISEFHQYIQSHSREPRVTPHSWGPVLTDWRYKKWIYKENYNHACEDGDESMNQCISNIIKDKRPDFDEEVVVLPGVFRRVCQYKDIRYLQLNPWLKAKIRDEIKSHLGLYIRGYDVIHLRGGSKKWAGGEVKLKSLAKRLDKAFPQEEKFYTDMHQCYKKVTSNLPGLPLLLVSDSKQMINGWQRRFGQCLTVPTFNSVLTGSGTHKISLQRLDELKVKKSSLNLELIRDFILLTNSRSIVWDGMSLFALGAVKAKQSNSSLMWLESNDIFSESNSGETPRSPHLNDTQTSDCKGKNILYDAHIETTSQN